MDTTRFYQEPCCSSRVWPRSTKPGWHTLATLQLAVLGQQNWNEAGARLQKATQAGGFFNADCPTGNQAFNSSSSTIPQENHPYLRLITLNYLIQVDVRVNPSCDRPDLAHRLKQRCRP